VLQPELVEAAGDDEVDQVGHRLGAVVEAGRGEEDDSAGLAQTEQVLEMDGRQGRLPRDKDELPAFLQRDGGGPVDEVVDDSGRNRSGRAHRARADHVAVDPGRTAREG
jgi:hypothetical protein